MNRRSLALLHSVLGGKGFSLIELMVAIVIGLFLVIGATTLYVNSRKSSDVDDTTARLQETARYAMSIIETDVRLANYWGRVKNSAAITNKPSQPGYTISGFTLGTDAANCGNTYGINVDYYVEATDNSYGLACTPTVASASSAAVSSADTLTVRRASIPISTKVDNSLRICSNLVDAVLLKGNTCIDELHDLIVDAYYVDQRSDQSTTYPSLRRWTLGLDSSATPKPTFQNIEIIPGVQDMQVQLGWDSAGDTGRATQYVNPGSAILSNATGQVVAVRVWLLVRAERPDVTYTDNATYDYGGVTYTPNDNYRRLLVSRTIFLRNAVGT